MTRLLQFAVAVCVAGFAAVYFAIGSLFMLEWQPHGAHVPGVFGLFGFAGPLVVLCVHLAITAPDWSLRARKIMLLVYIVTVMVALLGMAPQLLYPDTRLEMGALMLKTIVWCGACGAPIIAAWLKASGHQA